MENPFLGIPAGATKVPKAGNGKTQRKKVGKLIINGTLIISPLIGPGNPEDQYSPRHDQVSGKIPRSPEVPCQKTWIFPINRSFPSWEAKSEVKPPTLADLRESGSIDQNADVVMFLHRHRETDVEVDRSRGVTNIVTELIVAKQRNGPTGPVKIAFLPKYTRFENLSYDRG